ncbi:MAG: matrixin family metalloprotease [Lacipirellulaceae bacterium]
MPKPPHLATALSATLLAALLLYLPQAATACEYCTAMGCATCGHSDAAPTSAAAGGPAAFVLQGGQWPQPGGLGSRVTITYSYNNFLDGGLLDPNGVSVPADYLRLVTYEAFSLWAQVAPLHFVEVADVGTPVFSFNSAEYLAYPASSFGQIRLNHLYINGTDEENGFPTTKAQAFFPFNGGNIAGDIQFDNGDPWAVIGTRSQPDVLGILTHEIGHTIGLGHATIVEATMNPAAPRRRGPGTGSLHPDDIAGVRAIYGVGVGSVTLIPEPAAIALLLSVAAMTSPARRRAA